MPKALGKALPAPLRFEIGEHSAQSDVMRAILLVTIDADGEPRIATLAASKITWCDERRLLVQVLAGSSAERNLASGRTALLWNVLDAAAYSIRATPAAASQQPRDSNCRAYEFSVIEVARDFEPGAPMIAGPTYRRLA